MRTTALCSVTLGMMLTVGTAAAEPMQWWPAKVSTSNVGGISSTTPVRVPFTAGPDSIRKFALVGIEAWEKSDSPCGFRFIAGKLDPAASGGGGATDGWWGECARKPSPQRAVLPAGEFVNSIQVCINKTGDAAVLKGVRLHGIRFDANGRFQQGTTVEYKRPNCQATEWSNTYTSCGADRVATAVFVHTGPRGARGLSLECRTAYLLTAEPPKVKVWMDRAGFDTANGGKISATVSLQNNFGENVNAPSIKVDMRGNGTPGAGKCSGSPTNSRMVVPATSDLRGEQPVRIDFACSWANIATTPGCESVATTNYVANQFCSATLDVIVDGRVQSSTKHQFSRGGNPLP